MALVRSIKQDIDANKWRYVETDSADATYYVVIGERQFDTVEEVQNYAQTVEDGVYPSFGE